MEIFPQVKPNVPPMELPLTDQRHLEHASGYMELGMFDDANQELDKIVPEHWPPS